ncbi:MAG TPA: hypothetical protein PK048_01060 [Candidatus Absconditabacterales bacterium]|nr:hypothetical protein [Candidatus Absconditabacterales bacterium]
MEEVPKSRDRYPREELVEGRFIRGKLGLPAEDGLYKTKGFDIIGSFSGIESFSPAS